MVLLNQNKNKLLFIQLRNLRTGHSRSFYGKSRETHRIMADEVSIESKGDISLI